MLIDKYKNPFK